MKKKICAVMFLLMSISFLYAQEARLLRQPHICNNEVVFVYGGDLWKVSAEGGEAKQLTTFKGLELFPRFSPDGKQIAFSGMYSGNRQIYVIPSHGGEPQQLTYYPDVGEMPPRGGWDNIPVDWTPDSKKILYNSNRTPYGQRVGKYFLVDASGKQMAVPLQLPEGGPASLSEDGSKIAYCIKSREFRTWKRYKAGRAQDIYIYDLKKNKTKQITQYPGTDNFPLWIDDQIYFISDREGVDSEEPGILNIFKYNIKTEEITQVTDFTEYDCLWPSRGHQHIVFENGGYIYILDTATDEVKKLSVTISSDKPSKRPVYKNVADNIESFAASPSANRVLFSARGEIFSIPKKYGDIRNLTQTQRIREFSIDWSPDGKYISYLSEKAGDYELFIKNYHNNEKEVQLTENSECWMTGYEWSPDNNYILISDKKLRLRMIDVNTKESTLIDKGTYSSINSYNWSPDSRWIAYSKNSKNYLSSIWLYSTENKRNIQLTADSRDDYSPVFGCKGDYIYFISNRDYNWGDRNFDAKIYVGTLRFDMDNPFTPRSDEVKEDEKQNNKKDSKEELAVEIDIKGFEHRVKALPVKTGRYRALNAVDNGIIYIRDNNLYKFDMEKREESLIMENIRGYYLCSDKKNIVYISGDMYGIIPVASDQKSGTGKLNLKDLVLKVDPSVEYEQIFRDAWRIMRDWFYDPGMHGVDWYKMYDKYSVLVPHAVLRSDLDYIIGELIGELNAGHCYVHSGDNIEVDRVKVGLLGCEFVSDGKFYKIDNIFPGRNWNQALRSPLTESGIYVREGEYLIGIDNNIITTDDNPYKYLENKVDKTVQLRLNIKPTVEGSRTVEVRPIESELGLRHLQWIEKNRKIVDSLSGGRVGYIYVPNTSFNGFESFYKGWQEQFVKDGLIIDERYNGGGSIPAPMVFDISHPVLNYWAQRNLPLYSTPMRAHEGPKIMLINGRSSSGGDAFPAYFRKMDLGPLMGKTTWGGLIGYSYSPHFVDGGGMAVPSFAYVNTEGEWDVEYYGVKPDIEVFDDPTLIQEGREPMLEKAVQYILEQLKKNPPEEVKKPEGPDRS